jgi:hypothetical protein
VLITSIDTITCASNSIPINYHIIDCRAPRNMVGNTPSVQLLSSKWNGTRMGPCHQARLTDLQRHSIAGKPPTECVAYRLLYPVDSRRPKNGIHTCRGTFNCCYRAVNSVVRLISLSTTLYCNCMRTSFDTVQRVGPVPRKLTLVMVVLSF